MINLFYSALFALVDLCIFATLTGAISISNRLKFMTALLFLVALLMHIPLFNLDFLMRPGKFFKISMFSVALVVLHFMNKRNGLKMQNFIEKNPQINPAFAIKYNYTVNFIKYRLVYVMVFVFQIIAIWLLEFDR